jgi:hypothetical protein
VKEMVDFNELNRLTFEANNGQKPSATRYH